jgi:transposase-like protein
MVLSLSAKGLTHGEISAHLAEVYGAEVSKQTVSTITDQVMEGMAEWQNRPLDRVYPVLFVDAINVKIRDGKVANRPIYVVMAVTVDGTRDILGIWAGDGGEGAKYWLHVFTELKNRGLDDVLMLVCDGLKGLPEAVETVWPRTIVQTCVVHLIRHSLKYVPRREREQVARDLKPIYTAADADAAQQALEAFDEKWGKRFPVITQAWLNAWEYVIPFLAFPPEVRRVIYTTNAIEALNRQLRKALKTKGHFPNEDAARKLIYLAISNAVPAWTRTRNWTAALLAFKIHFGDRLPD